MRGIDQYALIGDTQTAALIATDGSIDWLCLPRFDSPACVAALLGDDSHGRWRLAPRGGPRRAQRRYRADTLVLETEFDTDSATARVVDCMPIRDGHPTVVRVVEGLRGRTEMEMDLTLRFDYGARFHGCSGRKIVSWQSPARTRRTCNRRSRRRVRT